MFGEVERFLLLLFLYLSSSVLSPWQFGHKACKLFSLSLPPLENFFMWSIWYLVGSILLHFLHFQPCLAAILFLSAEVRVLFLFWLSFVIPRSPPFGIFIGFILKGLNINCSIFSFELGLFVFRSFYLSEVIGFERYMLVYPQCCRPTMYCSFFHWHKITS